MNGMEIDESFFRECEASALSTKDENVDPTEPMVESISEEVEFIHDMLLAKQYILIWTI